MRSQEIRSSFLKFFADRGHKIVPSSPLIPHDDPTLLFTNAGMNQFKKVFLGLEKRDYRTAASSQKCIRAGGKHNDLENVGFTARHHTFFEMLGNFSFGDYFKEDAIAYAWEYITKTLGLEPSHLYATVFTDDDEAEKLWRKIAPALGDRVLRFGEKDNYWSMGETGPCGPCSEIHYDRGDKYPGELNGEGDRYMEIWNLVFMQFDRDESGNLTPLPKPSVDTGAGLERFAMILQNAESNYETDLFTPLIDRVSELSGIEYSRDQRGISHKVIADHIRALSFAIADGGIISNEGRGYVLRRILRRAARHGRLLDMHEPFLYQLVGSLTGIMGDHYPEVKSKAKHIELVLKSEEEQFGRTLDTGLEIFEDIVKKVESTGSNVIPGSDIFKLYDTYGFPVDLTEVMARERGLHADMEGFEEELGKQRERSKRHMFSAGGIVYEDGIDIVDGPPPRFVGYDNEVVDTKVITYGDNVMAISESPFYAESGGQVGDTGVVENADSKFVVENTIKKGDVIILFGHFELYPPKNRPLYLLNVTARVNSSRRADIKRNHTATHLLHKALRIVLGDHVHQSGSLVDEKRLRFDFTHSKAMTLEEIEKVESIVKEKIKESLAVLTPENDDSLKNLTMDKAKENGAMALFGEKYDDIVRVVKTSDDFSIELCGGTHVTNTADIGEFFIKQETAISVGMRRIEALTGRGAKAYLEEQEKTITALSRFVNREVENLSAEDVSQFKSLFPQARARLLKKRNLLKSFNAYSGKIEKHLRKKQKEEAGEISAAASELEPAARIGNELILIYKPSTDNAGDLLAYLDTFKKKYPQSTIVVVSGNNGTFAISSPEYELSNNTFNEIVTIAGARGGGKPTIRGSMDVKKIDAVIEGLKKKFEG